MRTQPRDPPREQLRDRGQAVTSASGVQAGAQHAQGLAGRDGTISVEVASSTSVVMSLTGYWKPPTATDTGLGLHPLDAPERLVDTTTGTGTCNDNPCARLGALSDTTVAAAGHAGIPVDASAIMVAVNVIDPAGPGLLGIGAEAGQSSGAFVFNTGDSTQASFITPLSEAGTLNANSWAATDLTIDVIGYFTAPTRTYRYSYETTGLRASKSLDDNGVAGAGWSKEFTWDTSSVCRCYLLSTGDPRPAISSTARRAHRSTRSPAQATSCTSTKTNSDRYGSSPTPTAAPKAPSPTTPTARSK